LKYTYLYVECHECKSCWPLYYADGERTEPEMQELWKELKSSALQGSDCPFNHGGGFWFPEDFTLRCLEEPPSKYPSAIRLGSSSNVL
jgi:hypothetical protein